MVVLQTQIMREQQRASVLPYLMLAVQSSINDNRTYLTVRNAGIGPALLGDVRVRYKGKDFVGDPYDFFVQQRPEVIKTVPMGVDKLIPGRLVPAGEWIMTMGADGEKHNQLLAELLRLFVDCRGAEQLAAGGGSDRTALGAGRGDRDLLVGLRRALAPALRQLRAGRRPSAGRPLTRERLPHLGADGFRRGARIRSGDDRPPDDQIGRTCPHGLARPHRATLVVLVGAGGGAADAGRHHREIAPAGISDLARLER